MNLARHAGVLWRFRAVTAGGLLLGLILALLASYQVGPSGIKKRGTSVYSSTSSVLVTQPGFPEGRSVFPATPPPTSTSETGEVVVTPPNRLEFADPGRFPNLAELYAQLATSDQVRTRIKSQPNPAQITALAMPNASGSQILPVIQFTTTAPNAEGALSLNKETADALRGLIADQQAENKVPSNQRIELPTLNAASPPALIAGPSHTGAILALLLSIIGTIAVTHILAAIGDRRWQRENETFEELLVPWPIDENGSSAREQERAARHDRVS